MKDKEKLDLIESKLRDYENRIQRLKRIERELDSLDTEGFESEVIAIKSKLKDPKKVEVVERELSELKLKIEKRKKAESTIKRLEILAGFIPDAEELLKIAEKEFKRGNYDTSLSYLSHCEKVIMEAEPELEVELSKTSFIFNRWENVEIKVKNYGDGFAKEIRISFSDDVVVRNLPEIDFIEPGISKSAEFSLRPVAEGEIPLEVTIVYRNLKGKKKSVRRTIR
ncbi:hypothetical protein DRN52_08290, partial [Thermococci archaeon]